MGDSPPERRGPRRPGAPSGGQGPDGPPRQAHEPDAGPGTPPDPGIDASFRPSFRVSDHHPDPDRDVRDEIAFYLEMREAELLARGVPPDEARARAREAFGDVHRLTQEVRRMAVPNARRRHLLAALADVTHDLRYAFRALARGPGFALAVILTLGLAIGGNTAIFGLADAALLRSPPVREPERLVALYTTCRDGEPRCSSSFPDYLDYRAGANSLQHLAATAELPVSLSADEGARLVRSGLVTGNFFGMLGLPPARGRLLQPTDEEPGAAVAVLSHALWRSGFGGDPDVLGRTLRLNGHPFTVVGVAPEGFRGLQLGAGPDLWLPFQAVMLIDQEARELDALNSRGTRWIAPLVGRLAPGASVERARAELAALAERMNEAHPDGRGGRSVTVESAERYILLGRPEMVRRFVLLLHGVLALVLLLACANLANLLLARASARGQETAVRAALGAGRVRLLRQWLTEGAVLVAVGGVAGVAIAALLLRGLEGLSLPFGPSLGELDLRIDGRVLAFAAATSIVSGLLFAVAPTLRGTRANLSAALREGRGAQGGRAGRLRGFLVAAQMALCIVVLSASLVFLRALRHGTAFDFNFPVRGLALATFDPILAGHTPETSAALAEDLVARLEARPGVVSAAVARRVPMDGIGRGTFVEVEGYEPAPDEELRVEYNFAGPGFFRTLGLPLAEGRDVEAGDAGEAGNVAVVSASMARRFWPGREALGGVVSMGGRSLRVVGVTADTRWRGFTGTESPFITLPAAAVTGAAFGGPVTVLVRARGEAEARALLPVIRESLRGLDPDVSISDLRSMEAQLADELAPQRLAAALFTAFAVLGLVLAAVGTYGVVSFAVTRRLRELAIRAALGAGGPRLLGAVARMMVLPMLGGVVVGLLLTARLGGAAEGLTLGIAAAEPVLLAATTFVLLAVAAAAVLLPSRRALRVEPMEVLRVD